jgi:hypothetical protein
LPFNGGLPFQARSRICKVSARSPRRPFFAEIFLGAQGRNLFGDGDIGDMMSWFSATPFRLGSLAQLLALAAYGFFAGPNTVFTVLARREGSGILMSVRERTSEAVMG